VSKENIKTPFANRRFILCAIALLTILLVSFPNIIFAQNIIVTNIPARKTISLNGKWQYIIDPYETGFYDYRFIERNPKDKDAYWNTDVPANKSDKLEHGYSIKNTLTVPGDWNAQDKKFLYYEGTVWYKKSFDFNQKHDGKIFVHFGAVNYKADVYLNGTKLGMHKGGFTPFNFEVPVTLLKAKNNWLVVKADNKRSKEEVPTLNTDWWNYGGITRDVNLVLLPQNYIQDYSIQLSKAAYNTSNKIIEGWVKLNNAVDDTITIEIPALKIKQSIAAKSDSINFSIATKDIQPWSYKSPTLYKVVISTKTDRIEEKIGFRNIEVQGKQVLLNGKPVFLRGICIHEEIPNEIRRAVSYKDALQLLGRAKALNANMVRLAHYPHNENMTRVADSLGLLVWSEIPVYWTINFGSKEVLEKAATQLQEMIARDRNRVSIIIWSVGNETPPGKERLSFMSDLAKKAKAMDATRLIGAALENFGLNGEQVVKDELAAYTDIIAVNQYIGWYGGLPDNCRKVQWAAYNKPFFFSETGAEAVGGLHGDSATRWTEEFQEWYYKEQVAMMKRMPNNFLGVSPWLLNDFRSPRRNNPVTQDGWNNKGLFDQKGRKKKAFYILKKYYDEMEKLYE
jgi:beta-glucuronidase